MNNEYFNGVKKQMELFTEAENLNPNISDSVKAINDIFQAFRIQDAVNLNDIEFSNPFFWNKPYLVWDETLDSEVLRNPLLRQALKRYW